MRLRLGTLSLTQRSGLRERHLTMSNGRMHHASSCFGQTAAERSLRRIFVLAFCRRAPHGSRSPSTRLPSPVRSPFGRGGREDRLHPAGFIGSVGSLAKTGDLCKGVQRRQHGRVRESGHTGMAPAARLPFARQTMRSRPARCTKTRRSESSAAVCARNLEAWISPLPLFACLRCADDPDRRAGGRAASGGAFSGLRSRFAGRMGAWPRTCGTRPARFAPWDWKLGVGSWKLTCPTICYAC